MRQFVTSGDPKYVEVGQHLLKRLSFLLNNHKLTSLLLEKSLSVKIDKTYKISIGMLFFELKVGIVIYFWKSLSVRLKSSKSISVRIGSSWIGITTLYETEIEFGLFRLPLNCSFPGQKRLFYLGVYNCTLY